MSEPSTDAVQGGTRPDPTTGALAEPIHPSTTYAQDEPGQARGFTYSRSGNPTVAALEDRLTSLTAGIGTVAFSSGMAAIDATLRTLLEPGDTLLVSDVVYGGTDRLIREHHAANGIEVHRFDAADLGTLPALDEAGLVLVETPANPTLDVADLDPILDQAGAAGVPVAVDNTFLTPVGQPVLSQGADLAIHSTTKYLEGHGTAVGGAVIVRSDPDAYTGLQHVRKTTGTICSPWHAWLTLRGIETLPLRLERVSATAQRIAERLDGHPAVDDVRYPGLASDPQHEIASRQHEHHGGLLAFELAGGREAVDRFLGELETITLAEHLGTSRTLVTHPATMTHESVPADRRAELGITDGLVRLSAGLESPEDLLPELDQALDRARAPEAVQDA